MELIKGVPITKYCDEHHLTPKERLALFVPVCQAVQHAHQKGIIHRDLKPSNVLVCLYDGKPMPKVIDFGVAKATGQKLTNRTLYTDFGAIVGTLEYMSPEQAQLDQLDIDTRSDIYSLGVLLYELLTGTTPIERKRLKTEAFLELLRIIREVEPPKPSSRLTDSKDTLPGLAAQRKMEPARLTRAVRGELDWIVMKCLDKDRARRYETANGLARDVERYLHDEPVEAGPPSAFYRFRKFADRNRSRLAAAGLVLTIVLVAILGFGAVYLQNTARIRETTQDVRQLLAGARAAIDAHDLTLASQRAGEAQARLGKDSLSQADLAIEVDDIQKEIGIRRTDEARFREFQRLTSDSLDRTGFNQLREGDRFANEALDLYGVLTDDDWLARLDASSLTINQKADVRETAYVVLVTLADSGIRWDGAIQAATRSLELLQRAQSFHEPTRAFYFVRSSCFGRQGNSTAAKADDERLKAATARTAWDYYLPGHSAGWGGNLEEAIRSYQAALAVQPNHFNSLFFLADRLATNEINRKPEGIQLFTACIALRPKYILPYVNRAEIHHHLGHLNEAEADYSAAIAAATAESDESAVFSSYHFRMRFYETLGRAEEAQQDRLQYIELVERWLLKNKEPADDMLLIRMHNLGLAYSEVGRFNEAIAMLEQTLEKSKTVQGIGLFKPLDGVRHLATTYQNAGRPQDARSLYERRLKDDNTKFGSSAAQTLKSAELLADYYLDTGQADLAIPIRQARLDAEKAALRSDPSKFLIAQMQLAAAYLAAGRFEETIRTLEKHFEDGRVYLGLKPSDPPSSLDRKAIDRVWERWGIRGVRPMAKAMDDLATAYQAVAKQDRALLLYEQTLDARKTRLGLTDPDTIISLEHLASALDNRGEHARAEPLLREVLAYRRKRHGNEHPSIGTGLAVLGTNLLKQKKFGEAEVSLRECLKIRDQQLPDDWARFNAQSLLGGALFGQKKYTEARPLLLAGYEGMKKREATISAPAKIRVTEALARLVQFCDATGEKNEGDKWRKKLAETKDPSEPPEKK